MKTLLLFSSVLGMIFLTSLQSKPIKVIFFGDSITEQGTKPGGFIPLIGDLLKQNGQQNNYELAGAGIGGNKVYDLFLRFEDDVLVKKPDVVFIYIGVNDVWHKQTHQTGTDPDKFVAFYTAMIKKLQANNVRVILCTPAAIGEKTDFTNELDGDLNKYSQTVRDLATRYNLKLVDLRKAFLEYNLKNNPQNKESGILTVDRVHLNPRGNQLVAGLMLEALNSK
jgi:lysophospholipase L1-like esterase